MRSFVLLLDNWKGCLLYSQQLGQFIHQFFGWAAIQVHTRIKSNAQTLENVSTYIQLYIHTGWFWNKYMRGNFLLPLFPSRTFPKDCLSCKMEHHRILCFLFMLGLTTILLVGGLGFEDQENCLREIPNLICVISLCGLKPNRKPIDQNEGLLIK
jgi:hypothetical protein